MRAGRVPLGAGERRAKNRPDSRARPLAATLASALLVCACAGPQALAPLGRAPERGAGASLGRGMHAVAPGDTLYAIAWRYAIDYRDLARWNAIAEPYTIYPGQQLRITRPATLPAMPRAEASTRASTPRAQGSGAQRGETAATRTRTRPEPSVASSVDGVGPVSAWTWPASGEVIATFGGTGGKGIDIAGARGAAVLAAAPGRVVYSGSGLRGYGQLIIVKHNKRYLSAYAHNERLHVEEGDSVVSGQRIADMGSSDAKSVRLHFEIRRDGKPVDPIRYLPR